MRREFWIKKGSYVGAPEYEDFYSSVESEPFKGSIHVVEISDTERVIDVEVISEILGTLWALQRENTSRELYDKLKALRDTRPTIKPTAIRPE